MGQGHPPGKDCWAVMRGEGGGKWVLYVTEVKQQRSKMERLVGGDGGKTLNQSMIKRNKGKLRLHVEIVVIYVRPVSEGQSKLGAKTWQPSFCPPAGWRGMMVVIQLIYRTE